MEDHHDPLEKSQNSEGYSDPTASEAIRHASTFGFRPLVYICSPYSGNIEKNLERARAYSRFAVDEGCIPITPHLMFPQFMNERTERELAMHMDLVLLKHCKELWVFGEEITSGMQEEIELARKRNLTVKHFSDDGKAVKLFKEEVWIRK